MGAPTFGASLQELRSLVDLSRVPGQAWIDGDGRVRKFDLTIKVLHAGQSAKAVVDMRFSHFDEPVTVEAPAPAGTVSFRAVPHFLADMAAAASKGPTS